MGRRCSRTGLPLPGLRSFELPGESVRTIDVEVQNVDQSAPTGSGLLALRGTRPLFAEELRTRVEAGAKCVRFEYCFSLLAVTVRRQSPVYLTHSWQQRYLLGLWYSVLALLLGPWGVPWGLLWTPWAVWVNATGGADCTVAVLASLDGARRGNPHAHDTTQHEEVRSP